MKYDSRFVKKAIKERLIEESLNEYALNQPLTSKAESEIKEISRKLRINR